MSVRYCSEIGDILNWENEKWIIFQKERRVNETYQVFYHSRRLLMIRRKNLFLIS